MSSKIKSIKSREILDSRGDWTVEVDLVTDQGLFVDSVPSGVSRGKYEAVAIKSEKAAKNINKVIAPKLKGKDSTKQKEIDDLMRKLDGTENKSRLGGNAIVAVSMACCRAGAAAKNLPLYKHIAQISGTKKLKLPTPLVLMIEGGAHAGSGLDFQEFMIVPQLKEYSRNLKLASDFYQRLKKKLGTNVGDEGGFAPPLQIPEQALELIKENKIIIDVAASQFYADGKYKTRRGVFTREGLIRYYHNLIKKYPIIGLEDPFAETDLESWQKFRFSILGGPTSRNYRNVRRSDLLIIGDDLLVTNPERIKMAKRKNLCNGLLLKVNQIGTVTESLEAARLAKSYDWEVIVSHRGGETCDDFIADFAVGIGADYIKTGAPARGERVAKYNRLLTIEEELK